MAQKTLVHKGYHGTIVVNNKDYTLSGKILFLDEEISYEGTTFEELESSFQKAVEKHIHSCLEKGKQPPF